MYVEVSRLRSHSRFTSVEYRASDDCKFSRIAKSSGDLYVLIKIYATLIKFTMENCATLLAILKEFIKRLFRLSIAKLISKLQSKLCIFAGLSLALYGILHSKRPTYNYII